MFKDACKRFASMVLALLMVLAVFPCANLAGLTVYAASGTVSGLSNTDIILSYNGDEGVTWTANADKILGSATSEAGVCDATHYRSTLTIKNNKATKAILMFNYTVALNTGSIQIDGTEITSDGTNSFSKELNAGDTVTVSLSSKSTTAATMITIENIALVADVTATTTFVPSENGSYTVDGTSISEFTTKEQPSTVAYNLSATPVDGYKFFGWYNITKESFFSSLVMSL